MNRRGWTARGVRAARVVLGVVVVASLLGAAPVRAQTNGSGDAGDPGTSADTAPSTPSGAGFGGFEGSAIASGLHVRYNAGDILPIPPPVDLGTPDALATIASGPSTFARASVADPGDLLANPEAFLALASADYPVGTLPAYPYRVSAASGVGQPVAEVSAAPGLDARVEVTDSGSRAQASMPAFVAPALVNIGSLSSVSTTTTDGTSVAVHARTQVSGINILDVIQIDSLVTDVNATSDGADTKVSGGTTVTGAASPASRSRSTPTGSTRVLVPRRSSVGCSARWPAASMTS